MRRINLAIWVSVIVLCLGALLSYFLFDERVSAWFRDNPSPWHNNILIKAIRGFGRAWAPIWLLITWAWATGRQRPVQAGLLALLLIFPIVCTLKPLVHRARPREIIAAAANPEKTGTNNNWSKHQSFPSGDAAVAFAAAAALVPFVRWPWTLIFFTIAGIVGFMRVVVLAHFPSDVCAGAAIGIFSGWLAIQIVGRWLSEPSRFNFSQSVYATGVVLTPVLLGIFSGINNLLFFLEAYGVLVAGICLAGKGPAWLKRFRGGNADAQ